MSADYSPAELKRLFLYEFILLEKGGCRGTILLDDLLLSVKNQSAQEIKNQTENFIKNLGEQK